MPFLRVLDKWKGKRRNESCEITTTPRMKNLLSEEPDSPSEAPLYLSDLSPKDKPWDAHRAQSDAVQRIYAGYRPTWRHAGKELRPPAERMASCAGWLEFGLTPPTESGERLFRLQQASFCRVATCPVCQWRRTLKWSSKLRTMASAYLRDNPKDRWLFLTLTIRNCELENLTATLNQLSEGWVRLVHRKAWPARGFVRKIEITINRDKGTIHPHLHVLMSVRSSYFKKAYISHEKWVQLWRECLRVDYDPIVNVKVVKPKTSRTNTSSKVESNTSENSITESASDETLLAIESAIRETIKYTVKPGDIISPTATDEENRRYLIGLSEAIHHRRLITFGGLFKSYLKADENEDQEDLIDVGESEEGEEHEFSLTFDWLNRLQRYVGRN